MSTEENIKSLMKKYENNFKLSEVCYVKSSKLLCLNILSLVDADLDLNKAELEGDIKHALNADVNYNFNYIKPVETIDYYSEILTKYFKENYNYEIAKDDFEIKFEEIIKLKISLSSTFYLKIRLLGVEENLLKYLDKFTFKQFNLSFEPKIENTPIESKVYDLSNLAEEREKMLSEGIGDYEIVQNDFKISGLDIIVGKNFTDKAMCLNQIKGEMEFVQVAGKIRYFTERSFKKVVEKDGQSVEQEKVYYTFEIYDGFGKIRASYFPTKQYLESEKHIGDDQILTFCGKAEVYRDNLSLKVKELAYCCLPEGQIKDYSKKIEQAHVNEEVTQEKKKESEPVHIQYKTEPESYSIAFPCEYCENDQIDLFSAFATKKDVCSMLKDKDYVVFDLETTGLDYSNNEILEIGAVKIRNGEIIETFNTLIKPMTVEISDFITDLTGISNDMVKDAPHFDEVVGDFFKFTRNSTMVAHNSDFDTLFLAYHAGKYLYKFDNPVLDTLKMARNLIGGVKNYKLGTIAKYFNIPLDHAHRALYDTIATAKCFIELCKLESK